MNLLFSITLLHDITVSILLGQLEEAVNRTNKLKEEKSEVQRELSESERTATEMRSEMREKDQTIDRLMMDVSSLQSDLEYSRQQVSEKEFHHNLFCTRCALCNPDRRGRGD